MFHRTYRDAGGNSAGIVIIQEAGGYVTTGHPETFSRGDVSIGDVMMGRRYCFVRAIAPSEVGRRCCSESLCLIFYVF